MASGYVVNDSHSWSLVVSFGHARGHGHLISSGESLKRAEFIINWETTYVSQGTSDQSRF